MAYYCVNCDEPCEPIGDIDLDGEGNWNGQYRCPWCHEIGLSKVRNNRLSDLDGLKEVPPP